MSASSASSASYGAINPSVEIAQRDLKQSKFKDGITAYSSDFSIISALTSTRLHKDLKQSESGKAILDKILHSAACVQYVTLKYGPYKSEPASNSPKN